MNSRGGDGAEVIYALRNDNQLPDLILEELAKEGQNIRKAYQRRLPSDPSKDYYFMQRETAPVQSLTIEYGFLDSTGDDVNQLKNDYPKFVDAVVRAVLKYVGEPIGEATTYTVESGDSLWSIAKKFNVTVEELRIANNLSNNLLQIGQKLKIPVEGEMLEPNDELVYFVAPGDSLYKIALAYNTTVDELVRYNNLKTTVLKVGQQILIPTNNMTQDMPNQNYITYQVMPGDSLYKIAQRYGTTVSAIRNLNNLKSDALSIGMQLKIPSNITSEEPTEPNQNYIEYIVKKGDNLYNIARNYNTNVNDILQFNNLTNSNLSIGQRLLIPLNNNQTTYTVKAGDSLYSIASRYNTTVDELKRKNNLTSNNLSIGQILYI